MDETFFTVIQIYRTEGQMLNLLLVVTRRIQANVIYSSAVAQFHLKTVFQHSNKVFYIL